MTVVSAEDDTVVYCTYFDQEGNLYGNPDGIAFQRELLRAGHATTPDEDEARENSKFGYA
jgi:endonuclease YncB( thermonuclease family)